MGNKLWQKGNLSGDAEIFCRFTTGNDYQLDHSYFLEHDLRATFAWAQALEKAGIYNKQELEKVLTALETIRINYNRGSFGVSIKDEDCHTAIENALINIAGEPGKKIHTGRSRNDQSLTMIRLFMKEKLTIIEQKSRSIYNSLMDKAHENYGKLFIGYSHTQQAMPTTLEHYFIAHAESFLDDARWIDCHVINFISQCPLGTGAGFGSQLEIDREFLTETLNMKTMQHNSLYCQNSRGKFELLYIGAMSQVMLSLQRLASDMVLYTSKEFGLFKMSDSLSQGSSMMPQKKNPDVFEMIRAKAADVMALEERVKMIVKGLPSGYNRDLQEIKACIVDAYNITNNCLDVMSLALKHVEADDERINSVIQKDITSTDLIISQCIKQTGASFRDIYLNSGLDSDADPLEAAMSRRSLGSPGKL